MSVETAVQENEVGEKEEFPAVLISLRRYRVVIAREIGNMNAECRNNGYYCRAVYRRWFPRIQQEILFGCRCYSYPEDDKHL